MALDNIAGVKLPIFHLVRGGGGRAWGPRRMTRGAVVRALASSAQIKQATGVEAAQDAMGALKF